jgi:hypothetical protein
LGINSPKQKRYRWAGSAEVQLSSFGEKDRTSPDSCELVPRAWTIFQSVFRELFFCHQPSALPVMALLIGDECLGFIPDPEMPACGTMFFTILREHMQIPSVPLKRLPLLAKRTQSRWSREGEGRTTLTSDASRYIRARGTPVPKSGSRGNPKNEISIHPDI